VSPSSGSWPARSPSRSKYWVGLLSVKDLRVAVGVMVLIEEQQNSNLVETDLTEVASGDLGSYLAVRGFFGIVRFVELWKWVRRFV
jgi:hypothetical protein